MKDIRQLYRTFVGRWERNDQWKEPGFKDAVDFMVTEAAEVLDNAIRLAGSDYYRTHGKDRQWADLVMDTLAELGQVIIMADIAIQRLGNDAGYSMEDAVSEALYRMHEKREEERGSQ